MYWIYSIVIWLSFGLCAFFAFRQALHMFQLNSYQDLSYKNYLRANRKKFRGPKQYVPCFLMLMGGISLPSMPGFFAVGAGLYLLVNRPLKAKKPLVVLDRVNPIGGEKVEEAHMYHDTYAVVQPIIYTGVSERPLPTIEPW